MRCELGVSENGLLKKRSIFKINVLNFDGMFVYERVLLRCSKKQKSFKVGACAATFT